MTSSNSTNLLESRLRSLLDARTPPKTLCPSEVPRSLSAAELSQLGASSWRDLMDATRAVVAEWRARGDAEVLQRGEVVSAEVAVEDIRGPIRVRRTVESG
ncbi:MAG: hypothetical protein M1832_004761 [Thelocarpon impressellum]|nr:MAG: hypothetical protein M1832_004761 [Thelocarpon impressellum]